MISNYNEFLDAVRERVDFMGMTRLEFDHQTGMQSGYMGKLLGRRRSKRFGEVSFDATLPAIGCRLILVEDPELTAKILARMTPRQIQPPLLGSFPFTFSLALMRHSRAITN
jgi:hypothetical protein